MEQPSWKIERADALSFINNLPDRSVNLFFFSPPYQDARLYLENGVDLGIALKPDAWVAWMTEITKACLRKCNGLVAFVVEGKTKKFKYSCAPILLMADLHRQGVCLRKPPIFHRVGIPGSGGPDWLRNDFEWIICATNGGKFPWSKNTAMGHKPKYGPGGEMSYRLSDGQRANGRNQWGETRRSAGHHNRSGTESFERPSHVFGTRVDEFGMTGLIHSGADGKIIKQQGVFRDKGRFGHNGDGSVKGAHDRHIAAVANPGNVIHVPVGGGLMGSRHAHGNEAPFPLKLAEFFIRSFCPPGGIVCDPMCGSGTTAHAAILHGRNFVGCDIRQSQVDLSTVRMQGITPLAMCTEEASHVPVDRKVEQEAAPLFVDQEGDQG